MKSGNLFLRQDVQAEPLVGRWFAWTNLISPGTAAFTVVERQLRAMESFVKSPDLHAASLRNPLLRSGPFIDLSADLVPEVATLVTQTRERCAAQMAFTQAVRDLGALLREQGKGGSLEALYREVPEILRGRVELYYDRHHRPDFRFFEALLYSSPLYDDGQQMLSLKITRQEEKRPFVFSTPRLPDARALDIPISFASPALDTLFSARTKATSLECLCDAFGGVLDERQVGQLMSLLTEQPPPPRPSYQGNRPRIRYFGHACLLIEAGGISILVDPLVSYGGEEGPARFSFQDLPERIDFVLITHAHHDHVVLETLLQLRHCIGRVIVPRNTGGSLQDPSLALMLAALGFKDVLSLSELESVRLGPDGELTALPFIGEHHDLLVQSKTTYHLRLGTATMLIAADSCNLSPELYRNIRALTGPVDTLFLGMECEGAPLSWVYGALFDHRTTRENDQARRGRGSNAAEGLDMVSCFDPSRVYVYAMGAEPWVGHILDLEYQDGDLAMVESDRFVTACIAQGREAERLYLQREICL
jgi:hypothetical protein